MIDGGFGSTELHAAAASVAEVLARTLGLGDEVRVGDRWSVDDGDSVLSAPLTGDADGRLLLAVNDVVGERLLADATVLEAAFAEATMRGATSLGARLTSAAVGAGPAPAPVVIIEITDAGVVTALAGLTLPVHEPPAAQDFEPDSFDESSEPIESHSFAALSVLNDVELVVTAELGRTTMAVRDLLELSPGMVVEIDRAAGAPIDLLVNGRRIAAGEVVVIDEEFGIRITDIAPIGDRRR